MSTINSFDHNNTEKVLEPRVFAGIRRRATNPHKSEPEVVNNAQQRVVTLALAVYTCLSKVVIEKMPTLFGRFGVIFLVTVIYLLVCSGRSEATNPTSEFDVPSTAYPADPSGAHDSSMAIEMAIMAACNSTRAGSVGFAKVVIAPGTYLIAPTDVNKHLAFTTNGQSSGPGCNNVEFVGLPGARGATILRAGTQMMGAIIFDAAAHTNLDIENITFDGNGSVLQNPTISGIGLVSFIGNAGSLTNIAIRNNVFENLVTNTQALKLDEGPGNYPSGSAYIVDNQFINNQTNFGFSTNTGYGQEILVVDKLADFQISRNYFNGNTSYGGLVGLYAYDGTGEVDHNVFDNNFSTTGDMYVQQSSHVLFDHNLDTMPIDGSVAIRIVNCKDITVNGDDIIAPAGSNTTASAAAVGTISLGGTFSVSDVITTTINNPNPSISPVVIPYTTASGGTLASSAAAIATLINSSFAGSYVVASASGTTINLQSPFPGPGGNAIMYGASSSGGTISVTPTASTPFTGGLGPPSYGVFIYDDGGYATNSIALAGTYGSGQTIKATLTSGSTVVNAQYITVSGDTLSTAAAGLAASINSLCGSSCFVQKAVSSGTSIPLYSTDGTSTANSIALSVVSGSSITLTAASPTFLAGGTFDGVSPIVITATSDITVSNTTFNAVYRGAQIPGKFGVEAYSENQTGITLANDIAVNNGDALLYLPLLDSSAALAQVRLIGGIVKDGSYANGLLSIAIATGSTGTVTDMLVQGGACGYSSASSPVCIRVNSSTAKLMGIDMTRLSSPVSIGGSGMVNAIGNLGY